MTLRGPEIDELRARLNVRAEYPDDYVGPDGVRVPRAPGFRKEPKIYGTELAKDYETLARNVPEIRGRASYINRAMPRGVIQMLLQQMEDNDPAARHFAKEQLERPGLMNVLGTTNPADRSIFVQDMSNPAENMDTMAHEFQHLMGMRGEGVAGLVNPMASEKEAGKTGALAQRTFFIKSPARAR
jgi:hypothetical protein